MIRFAITIFISAFLVFQIQPIIARYILPWYGGTSSVWTACILFFQLFLLLGYSYAHILRLYCKPINQIVIHTGLLLLALLFLPIVPDTALKPDSPDNPLLGIWYLLFVSIGIPYWLVSASGPLIQFWFKESFAGSSPYRLYSLSNVGSLLALLSYPFFIEPNLGLELQAWIWSAGFVLYVVLSLTCARKFYLSSKFATRSIENKKIKINLPVGTEQLLWLILSSSGSVLLLAVTNQITQDVASFPFLWLLPLSLYLLSFIICFDHSKWYDRRIWVPLYLVSLSFGFYIFTKASGATLFSQIFIHTGILFTGCMICHGEMVRIKPDPNYLTSFYLMIALGGVLGGAFVTLIAPLIFNGYWELQLIWCFILILIGFFLFKDYQSDSYWKKVSLQFIWVSICGGLGIVLLSLVSFWHEDVIDFDRNFYGILRVKDKVIEGNEYWNERELLSGSIIHGSQRFDDEAIKRWPTTYFGWNSGIAVAINEHPRYKNRTDETQKFHVGAVGMGTATIAALVGQNDVIRFYEINPKVEEYANKYFTYIKDTLAEWQLVIGDARVSMEQELIIGDRQQFDVLAIDAFSGDAIPVHLLTIESFQLYWQHLKEDGILAVHISNRHLDLYPVVKEAAQFLNKNHIVIDSFPQDEMSIDEARWVLITNNYDFIQREKVRLRLKQTKDLSTREITLWTDDYSNLIDVLQ